jgi:hypothetical protein
MREKTQLLWGVPTQQIFYWEKRLQGEPKNHTFAFFGEKFSKIIYKGYFHAIFEKKFCQ